MNSYGKIRSPRSGNTSDACKVNSGGGVYNGGSVYGSDGRLFTTLRTSLARATRIGWLRSPITDYNHSAYPVKSDGDVYYGSWVVDISYGRRYSFFFIIYFIQLHHNMTIIFTISLLFCTSKD